MNFPPAPDPDNRPTTAKITHLGVDDDWTLAPELEATTKIFQQDSLNLSHVQTGFRAEKQQEVMLASYNEAKIRHFYETLFEWLDVDETAVAIT